MTWGEQTGQRTGRVSTQGPDQIIPYCTRRSFMLMHESLVRQENMLTELGATDLLSQIRLKAMVTLMVENFFSLMRKDDPMPTQLEYGIRRASCIRELQKKMYRGQFHYYTGPKSYYPNKVIDAFESFYYKDTSRFTFAARKNVVFGPSIGSLTNKEATLFLFLSGSVQLRTNSPSIRGSLKFLHMRG